MLPISRKKPFSAQVAGTVTNVTTGQNPTFYTVLIYNNTAAVAYMQIFYKAAASVTLGTTTADAVITIPASAGVAIDAGWHINSGAVGVSIACTTSRTNNTGASCDVFIIYD